MSIPSLRKLFGTLPGGHAVMMIIGLSVLIFIAGQTNAQKSFHHKLRNPGIVLEGRIYYGWMIDHHIEMTPLTRHFPAFEISVLKATYGRTRWEYMYNYPLIGVSYWYSDLGGVEPLGQAHAVFPYINFPLLHKNGFNIYFRLGVGVGYLTKKYERYDNFENLAIGSHLNGAVNLLFEARIKLGRRFMASGGISLMHFSNGAMKQPNYGINIPGLNLAMAYRLKPENLYLRKKLLPELIPFEFDGKKFLRFDISTSFGTKDFSAALGGGNQYIVTTVFGNLLWPVSYKSNVGFGFDIAYDGSDKKQLEIRGIVPEHWINLVKTGITGSYELTISRMAIMLNLGVSLSGLERRDGFLYEKLALRFAFSKNLFGSVNLLAYYGKADYLTFGLGYRIRVKYYGFK